ASGIAALIRAAASCAFFSSREPITMLWPALAQCRARPWPRSPAPPMMAIFSLMCRSSGPRALCHAVGAPATIPARHSALTLAQDHHEFMARSPIQVFPLPGLPEVKAGDDLARLIVEAAHDADFVAAGEDVFVVAQKVVSKAEGRIVKLDTVSPSE